MAYEWTMELIKGAKELATFAGAEASKRRASTQVQETQELIKALRFIYFSPRGVIKLLDNLAEGIQPSKDQIAMILPSFNDYEFRVHRMLQRINPDVGDVQGGLTLRATRVLREISNGKSGVRAKVKDLLNEALTLGEPISKDAAAELRNEILALNAAIEAAEEALVASIR